MSFNVIKSDLSQRTFLTHPHQIRFQMPDIRCRGLHECCDGTQSGPARTREGPVRVEQVQLT
jgi:hypothetical protein